jgi:hypothetical protein
MCLSKTCVSDACYHNSFLTDVYFIGLIDYIIRLVLIVL